MKYRVELTPLARIILKYCVFLFVIVIALTSAIVFFGRAKKSMSELPLIVDVGKTEIYKPKVKLSENDERLVIAAVDFASRRYGVSKNSLSGEVSKTQQGQTVVLVKFHPVTFGGYCMVIFNDGGEVVDVLAGE